MKYLLMMVLFVAMSAEAFAGCAGGVCRVHRSGNQSNVRAHSSVRQEGTRHRNRSRVSFRLFR